MTERITEQQTGEAQQLNLYHRLSDLLLAGEALLESKDFEAAESIAENIADVLQQLRQHQSDIIDRTGPLPALMLSCQKKLQTLIPLLSEAQNAIGQDLQQGYQRQQLNNVYR